MPLPGQITLHHGLHPGEAVTLAGQELASLLEWKPRPGEALTVVDSKKAAFRARLASLCESSATLAVFEEAGRLRDPVLEITLVQALPEKERMELIIQKTTELGVTRIVPFKSGRSTSLEDLDAAQKKSHRWKEVALKAAKQSRAFHIAEVMPYCAFTDALRAASGAQLKLALWEARGVTPVRDALKTVERSEVASVAMLVGPEGGFSPEEMEKAEKAGFTPVSLGRRILRTETAAIAAVGIIQYELGD